MNGIAIRWEFALKSGSRLLPRLNVQDALIKAHGSFRALRQLQKRRLRG
jgi:hypothetical protein